MKHLFKKSEFLLIALALILVFGAFNKIILQTETQTQPKPTATLQPRSHPKIDLTLNSFDITPNTTGSYTVDVPIKLIGSGSAELFSLYFSVNSNIAAIQDAASIRRLVVGHVDSHEPQSIIFKNIQLPRDLNKICAWVDPLGQIVETNESNNTRCQQYSTRPSATPKISTIFLKTRVSSPSAR